MKDHPLRRRLTRAAVTSAIAGLAIAAAPSGAQAFTCGTLVDTFNRATLGSSWDVLANTMQITSNQAVNPNASPGIMRSNAARGLQACADITAKAGGPNYAAIPLRLSSAGSNVFLKVQDNNGNGAFESVARYTGNNNQDGDFALNAFTPFSSARMHVAVSGTTARIDVDTDFDNVADQSRTFTIPASDNIRVGLGSYNGATLDNFRVQIDTVDPTAAFVSPQVTAGQHTIQGTASDNIGVKSVKVSFVAPNGSDTVVTAACPDCGDTAQSVTWSLDLDSASLPPGSYRARVVPFDAANRRSITEGPFVMCQTGGGCSLQTVYAPYSG